MPPSVAGQGQDFARKFPTRKRGPSRDRQQHSRSSDELCRRRLWGQRFAFPNRCYRMRRVCAATNPPNQAWPSYSISYYAADPVLNTSLYCIGSVTKVFTASLMLTRWLSGDATHVMYTPNVAGANALLGEPPTTVGSSLTSDTGLKIYNVTLTQLATHSACINDKMIPANAKAGARSPLRPRRATAPAIRSTAGAGGSSKLWRANSADKRSSPSAARHYWPFQQWARRAEPVHPSPIGILIHPRYGLWHSYRGALAFRQALPFPEPAAIPSPCDSCRERWCLKACPVGAFSSAGYDVAACVAHVKSASGADCMGLAAARVAPARSARNTSTAPNRQISSCARSCAREPRPMTS